jgi:HSP20 family protein
MIEAVVPGLKAEDLSITFENGILSISGEIRQSEESKDRNFHRVERRFGRFSRSVSLPTTVRGDAIEARLEHGVLFLTIPKAEEVKPRKITVSVNSIAGEQKMDVRRGSTSPHVVLILFYTCCTVVGCGAAA